MSKSGGVFQIDDVTRTMSKGGGACECLHPPPLQEILYPRLVFHPSKFRPPPPPHLDGWLRACWPSSATARGLGGGGNDKLAIDKGGNLPEKVENHWYRQIA